MVTRHNGLIAGTLALIAIIATGCSDRGKKADISKTQAANVAVPTTGAGEEGAGDVTVPAATGPVSFADGEAAYQARNYTEASRVFGRYVEQRPDNAWGHFMLGLSAWKGGDLVRAEKAFEEALRVDPNHVKSLVNVSRVLLDAKRSSDAIDKLARADELEPDSNEVQRLFGRAYHAEGKIDDAVAAYRRAIELDANDTWAMNNLGLLFLEQGRAGDALPLLARAVELRKDVAAFHNNLGMALEHTSHFSAAATAYSGALEADPGYEKARKNLARVEQVKESPKEPFDLEATAKRAVEESEASRTDENVSR